MGDATRRLLSSANSASTDPSVTSESLISPACCASPARQWDGLATLHASFSCRLPLLAVGEEQLEFSFTALEDSSQLRHDSSLLYLARAMSSSKGKTSFKSLLSKGASDPLISLAAVRQQRQRLEQLKQRQRPADAAPPPKRPAHESQSAVSRVNTATSQAEATWQAPAAPAPIMPSPPVTAAPGRAQFMPAAAFFGARPGYVFKIGDFGLGYYRDVSGGAVEDEDAMVASKHAAMSSALVNTRVSDAAAVAEASDREMGEGGAAAAVAAAALPTDFFDNPQQDPANKGKEVAATRKEQTLRDEMEEFQKQV
eukprot:2324708-Pleurochrysis_carterae.AAC.5